MASKTVHRIRSGSHERSRSSIHQRSAVVGGTGAFAHFKGTLIVGTGDKRVANTYRLTRTGLPVA